MHEGRRPFVHLLSFHLKAGRAGAGSNSGRFPGIGGQGCRNASKRGSCITFSATAGEIGMKCPRGTGGM